MNRKHSSSATRPLLVFALVGVLLALGLSSGSWLVPGQTAYGQTVPEATNPPSAATGAPTSTPFTLSGTAISGGAATATPAPGTAATPVPGAPGAPVPVSPGQPGTGTSGGGRCVITVTPGDVSSNGTIRVDEIALDDLPNRDPRYTYIRACDVVFIDENGNEIPNYPFASPVDTCIPYTADDVARAGGDPARLTIVYYDETTKQWVELEVAIDPASGQICAKQPISGITALVIRGAPASSLPNTSGNLPEVTPQAVAPVAVPAQPAAQPAAAAPAASENGDAAAAAPASAPARPAADAEAAPAAAQVAPAEAAPVSAAVAPASTAPESSTSDGPLSSLVVMAMGVAAAVFAVILVLSRRAFGRAREE